MNELLISVNKDDNKISGLSFIDKDVRAVNIYRISNILTRLLVTRNTFRGSRSILKGGFKINRSRKSYKRELAWIILNLVKFQLRIDNHWFKNLKRGCKWKMISMNRVWKLMKFKKKNLKIRNLMMKKGKLDVIYTNNYIISIKRIVILTILYRWI